MNVLMNVNLSKELEPQLNFFPLTLYKVTKILIILFTMTLNWSTICENFLCKKNWNVSSQTIVYFTCDNYLLRRYFSRYIIVVKPQNVGTPLKFCTSLLILEMYCWNFVMRYITISLNNALHKCTKSFCDMHTEKPTIQNLFYDYMQGRELYFMLCS